MAVDRQAVCEARIEGGTIRDIAKANNCTDAEVRKILVSEDLFDEQDDTLSRQRTTRMCAKHLKDLEREHGEK